MTLRFLRRTAAAAIVLAGFAGTAAYGQEAGNPKAEPRTATPIKHNNRYRREPDLRPCVRAVQAEARRDGPNLLSKGIVTEDGKPGPQFALARQFTVPGQTGYFIAADDKTPYDLLPAPQLEGTPNAQGDKLPPFLPALLGKLAQVEPNLSAGDLTLLTTGASGLASVEGVDTRVQNATSLPNGPFQLTGPSMPYDAYTGDSGSPLLPDVAAIGLQCEARHASQSQRMPQRPVPLRCQQLFQQCSGRHGDGVPERAERRCAYLKWLADEYTMKRTTIRRRWAAPWSSTSTFAMADNVYFSDGKGKAIPAPANAIANPNPAPGSTRYTRDARYTNCSDMSQPGVAPIVTYLAALPYKPDSKCAPGHYYVLNNQSPGYKTDGSLDPPCSPNGGAQRR